MIIKDRDVYILNTDGDLIDNATIINIDNSIDSILAKGGIKVVLDVAKTQYLTSKFLDICFFRLRELRCKNGDVKFVHVSPYLKAVFVAAGFFDYVDFFESVTDAVNSFSDNVSEAEKNMLWQ